MTQRTAPNGMQTFMIIWFGQLISIVGTGLTGFGLGVWVYQRTGSATLFALITLFTTLPGILISPFAGALVDRWDRRIVMIVSDVGAGLSTLAIALLIGLDRLEIWHIYVAMGISSICNGFQQPAYQVATTVLVPKEHHTRASGMMQAGTGAQYIISPVLAGALIGPLGIGGIILIDVITFFFALATLAIVRIPNPEATAEGSAGKGALLREMAQAWNYLAGRPGLLGVLLVVAIGNFMVGFVAVLAGPMMLSFTSPAMLGITMSVAGSGILVGSIVLGIWGGPQRLVPGMIVSMLLGGVGILLMGVQPNVILITAACFTFFFALPFVQGFFETIWRRKVVPDLQGRMFGFTRMVVMFTTTVAYLIGGPLADYVFEPLLAADGTLAGSVGQFIGVGPGRGIALLFIVAGALIVLTGVLGYLHPRVRRLEDELPDVIADEAALPEAQLSPSLG